MSVASSDSNAEYHAYSERTLAIIKPEAYEDAESIEDIILNNGFNILALETKLPEPTISSQEPTASDLSDFLIFHDTPRTKKLKQEIEQLRWKGKKDGLKIRRLQMKVKRLKKKRRHVRLTPEQAAELYKGHYGTHHFPHLVAHMSSGPIIALVLATRNGIQKWKTLMGPAMVLEAQAYWPDSLRACFGRRTKYGDYFNGLHGSENHAEAIREIHFFFPSMIVGPLVRHWQVNDYIQKHLTPTLLPALTALAHERPAEPILWLAEHLQRHNPNEPELAPQSPVQREDMRCHTPKPSEESLEK